MIINFLQRAGAFFIFPLGVMVGFGIIDTLLIFITGGSLDLREYDWWAYLIMISVSLAALAALIIPRDLIEELWEEILD